MAQGAALVAGGVGSVQVKRQNGSRWYALAHVVYSEEELCWLCGGYVNQALPFRNPMARSADHLIQLKHGGREYDRDNLRLAHLGCNSTRSGRIQNLARNDCACRYGRPCGPVARGAPRGMVSVDPNTV